MSNSFVNAQRKRRSEARMRRCRENIRDIFGVDTPAHRSADLYLGFLGGAGLKVDVSVKVENENGSAVESFYQDRLTTQLSSLSQKKLDFIVKLLALDVMRNGGCDAASLDEIDFEFDYMEKDGMLVKLNELETSRVKTKE